VIPHVESLDGEALDGETLDEEAALFNLNQVCIGCRSNSVSLCRVLAIPYIY
jgi:hypothetical protein